MPVTFTDEFLRGRPIDASLASPSTGAPGTTAPSTRFDPIHHATPEHFARSETFVRFAEEVRQSLNHIRSFARVNRADLDTDKVLPPLLMLEERILPTSAENSGVNPAFGTRAATIYGPVKALLDTLGERFRDDTIPHGVRRAALLALVDDDGLLLCADGVHQALYRCACALEGRASLFRSAQQSADAWLDDQALQLARDHVPAEEMLPADERHYVNGLERDVFAYIGRPYFDDALAKTPASEMTLAFLRRVVDMSPARVANDLAGRALARFGEDLSARLQRPLSALHDAFPYEEAHEALIAAANVLTIDVGEIPMGRLIEMLDLADDRDEHLSPAGAPPMARLRQDATLLALHLLDQMRADGHLIEPPEGAAAPPAPGVATRYAAITFALAPASLQPAATLHLLDRELAWVEEAGGPRGISVSDLSRLPTPAIALAGPFRRQNLGRAEAWTAHRSVVAAAALKNASPAERLSFPPAWLIDEAIVDQLVAALPDPTLGLWLQSKQTALSSLAKWRLLNALIAQRRHAVLADRTLPFWQQVNANNLPPDLWQIAAERGDPVFMRQTALLMLTVPPLAHTPSDWLENTLMARRPGANLSPLVLALRRGLEATSVLASLLISAFERGWLSKPQLLRILTNRRSADVEPLIDWLCVHAPDIQWLKRYAELLDHVQLRLKAIGHAPLPMHRVMEDDRSLFRDGSLDPAQAPPLFEVPPHARTNTQLLSTCKDDRWGTLMALYRTWLGNGSLSGEDFFLLVSGQPYGQPEPNCYFWLIETLSFRAPDRLDHYLQAIGSALRERLLTLEQFTQLAEGRAPGGSRSFLHRLLLTWSDDPDLSADTQSRLATYLNHLIRLRRDVPQFDHATFWRLLNPGPLAEDTGDPWVTLAFLRHRTARNHPILQCVEATASLANEVLRQAVRDGLLTAAEVDALLPPDSPAIEPPPQFIELEHPFRRRRHSF